MDNKLLTNDEWVLVKNKLPEDAEEAKVWVDDAGKTHFELIFS